MKEPKLTIELVPRTCWFSNVRSCVSKKDWDKLRKKSYQNAGYKCEICGGKGSRHPVECHEIWNYDDKHKIQKLERMIALCPSCHEVKHIGYASVRGRYDVAIRHLAKVNGWTEEQADNYAQIAFNIWKERSDWQWTLDLSFLDDEDVTVIEDNRRKGL